MLHVELFCQTNWYVDKNVDNFLKIYLVGNLEYPYLCVSIKEIDMNPLEIMLIVIVSVMLFRKEIKAIKNFIK
jgi:hypothetical protein